MITITVLKSTILHVVCVSNTMKRDLKKKGHAVANVECVVILN